MVSRSWIVLLLFLLWPGWVWSGTPLSEEQYGVLRNDILVTNQAEFGGMVAGNDDQMIADSYNSILTPAFWVWRTRVTRPMLYDVTTNTGTSWDWTQYKAQSAQEQNAWVEMWAGTGAINMAQANVRAGVLKIFSAPAAADQRTHIFTAGRREGTRAEKLFCTACVGSTTEPGVMRFEGALLAIDVAHALRGVPLP